MAEQNNICSFCGKHTDSLVYGDYGRICKECASLVSKLMDENFVQMSKTENIDIPKPRDMKKFLDQYVIGQDRAKEKICVAVYNHYKRLQSKDTADDVEIEKSNVIIVGPTGTGKCVAKDSIVTIRDRATGETFDISIDDFIKKLGLA